MADLSRGTALVQPTGAIQGQSTQDLEMGKFRDMGGGTVAVRTYQEGGGATGYSEGTTVGTANGNVILYRDVSGTLRAVGTAFPLPVSLQTLIAGEDITNNVLGVLPKPVASSTYAPSDHTNFGAAAGTGVLIKASAGNVFSVDVTSATTALRYFQLFNQGTVPVVGQTPVASYPLGSVPAGGVFRLTLDSNHFAPSKHFSTGIAAAISSTQGTLGTASITITDYSWHIKYV